MAAFRFQLDKILQYRRNRRDLCRQLLAQVFQEERALEDKCQVLRDQRAGLLKELQQLGDKGPVDVDRSAARRYHAGQLLGEIAVVEQRRDVVRDQLDLCRQALVKADQDVRVLEKLGDKKKEAFLYDEERRQAHELEDTWAAAHAVESVSWFD